MRHITTSQMVKAPLLGLGFVDEDASEEGAAAGEAAGPVSEAAVVC